MYRTIHRIFDVYLPVPPDAPLEHDSYYTVRYKRDTAIQSIQQYMVTHHNGCISYHPPSASNSSGAELGDASVRAAEAPLVTLARAAAFRRGMAAREKCLIL